MGGNDIVLEKKISVGLIGLGKTGLIVAESIFKDRRFELVFAVKKNPPKPEDFDFSVETKEMLFELIKKFKPNIIVDFSTPEATLENIKCFRRGMSLIIGTTGFSDKEVKKLKSYGDRLRVLLAPNISDGINILMKICKVINKLWKEADIEIVEQHFKNKKDVPSGTAKKIAQVFDKEVLIHAIRGGGIVGIHEVIFAMANQKITVRHDSFSREVFAQGVKRAILWLCKKKIGFYEISEMYKV